MNILDQLRSQSTSDKFQATINKQDASELVQYALHNPNDPNLQDVIEVHLRHLEDEQEKIGVHVVNKLNPIRIDYDNQVVIHGYNLIQAFIKSKHTEIKLWFKFVKTLPKTDTD